MNDKSHIMSLNSHDATSTPRMCADTSSVPSNNNAQQANANDFKYHCGLCVLSFDEYSQYAIHVKEIHNDEDLQLDRKPVVDSVTVGNTESTSTTDDNDSASSGINRNASNQNVDHGVSGMHFQVQIIHSEFGFNSDSSERSNSVQPDLSLSSSAQSNMKPDISAQHDLAHPNTALPNSETFNLAQLNSSESNFVIPDLTQSNSSRPSSTEPDTAQHNLTQVNSPQLNLESPDDTQSNSMQSISAQPYSTQSHCTQPNSVQTKSTHPIFARSNLAQSKSVPPNLNFMQSAFFKHKLIRSNSAPPILAKSNFTQINTAQSNLAPHHSTQSHFVRPNSTQFNSARHTEIQHKSTQSHFAPPNSVQSHLVQPNLAHCNNVQHCGVQNNSAQSHFAPPNLTQAHFVRPNLTQAHLVQPDLTQAHFLQSNLMRAHFLQPNLAHTHFVRPSLTQAHFVRPNSTQCNCVQHSVIQHNSEQSRSPPPNSTQSHSPSPNSTQSHFVRPNSALDNSAQHILIQPNSASPNKERSYSVHNKPKTVWDFSCFSYLRDQFSRECTSYFKRSEGHDTPNSDLNSGDRHPPEPPLNSYDDESDEEFGPQNIGTMVLYYCPICSENYKNENALFQHIRNCISPQRLRKLFNKGRAFCHDDVDALNVPISFVKFLRLENGSHSSCNTRGSMHSLNSKTCLNMIPPCSIDSSCTVKDSPNARPIPDARTAGNEKDNSSRRASTNVDNPLNLKTEPTHSEPNSINKGSKSTRIIYECRHCSKRTKSRMSWLYHQQMHLSTRVFNCIACKKTFTSKQQLLRHTRLVHMQTYECFKCSRVFQYYSIFNFHIHHCKNIATLNANIPEESGSKVMIHNKSNLIGLIPLKGDLYKSSEEDFVIGIPVIKLSNPSSELEVFSMTCFSSIESDTRMDVA